MGTLWGIFFAKQSLTMPNKLKWGPLVSSGTVCYAEKQENLFGSVRLAKWFNLTP